MALVLACQTSIQRKLNIPIDTLANNVQDVHEIMVTGLALPLAMADSDTELPVHRDLPIDS